MTQVIGCAGAALLAACIAGCGGSDSAVDGGSTSDDSGVATDAHLADASPPDASVPRRLPPSMVLASPMVLRISFTEDADGPGSVFSEWVAGCEVQVGDGTDATELLSAGEVSLTFGEGTQSFQPDSSGSYGLGLSLDPLPEPGDDIAVVVEGDEFPGFEITLTQPDNVAAIATPPLGEPLVIPRNQDLEVAWTGASEHVGAVAICREESALTQVRCPFAPGTDGIMPAEALGRLPANCPSGTFVVFTEDRKIITVDGVPVRVTAQGRQRVRTATIE